MTVGSEVSYREGSYTAAFKRSAGTTDVRWLKTRLNLWLRALEAFVESPIENLEPAKSASVEWHESLVHLNASPVADQLECILSEVRTTAHDLRGFAESANEQQQRILEVARLAGDGIAPVSKQVERLADRLKFTALNGELKATQCGAEGAAFQAITKELSHIAEVAVNQVKRLDEVAFEITQILETVEREHGAIGLGGCFGGGGLGVPTARRHRGRSRFHRQNVRVSSPPS